MDTSRSFHDGVLNIVKIGNLENTLKLKTISCVAPDNVLERLLVNVESTKGLSFIFSISKVVSAPRDTSIKGANSFSLSLLRMSNVEAPTPFFRSSLDIDLSQTLDLVYDLTDIIVPTAYGAVILDNVKKFLAKSSLVTPYLCVGLASVSEHVSCDIFSRSVLNNNPDLDVSDSSLNFSTFTNLFDINEFMFVRYFDSENNLLCSPTTYFGVDL